MDLGLFKIREQVDLGPFKIGGQVDLGLFKIKSAKRRSKVQEKNMSCERGLNFDP